MKQIILLGSLLFISMVYPSHKTKPFKDTASGRKLELMKIKRKYCETKYNNKEQALLCERMEGIE